jgi:hypothetical protein
MNREIRDDCYLAKKNEWMNGIVIWKNRIQRKRDLRMRANKFVRTRRVVSKREFRDFVFSLQRENYFISILRITLIFLFTIFSHIPLGMSIKFT